MIKEIFKSATLKALYVAVLLVSCLLTPSFSPAAHALSAASEAEMEPFPVTILISLIVVSLFVFIGSYWFGKNRK